MLVVAVVRCTVVRCTLVRCIGNDAKIQMFSHDANLIFATVVLGPDAFVNFYRILFLDLHIFLVQISDARVGNAAESFLSLSYAKKGPRTARKHSSQSSDLYTLDLVSVNEVSKRTISRKVCSSNILED